MDADFTGMASIENMDLPPWFMYDGNAQMPVEKDDKWARPRTNV
jgi:hypothetical protein